LAEVADRDLDVWVRSVRQDGDLSEKYKRAETERLGILRANERLDPVRLERIYQSIRRIEKVDNE
jgi:hypothetical protein